MYAVAREQITGIILRQQPHKVMKLLSSGNVK
jgi:hypothetical protein